MFDSPVEKTVILTGIALWVGYGWLLNESLKSVHTKLDSLLTQFDGLREYLYEIDPQFDDERASTARFETHMADPGKGDLFAGMDDMELQRDKKKAGKRTLSTRFFSRP